MCYKKPMRDHNYVTDPMMWGDLPVYANNQGFLQLSHIYFYMLIIFDISLLVNHMRSSTGYILGRKPRNW